MRILLMHGSSSKERRKNGVGIRKDVPRSSHGSWAPPADRRSPVDLLVEQDATRLQRLVPYRHQRMSESAFAFFRGSARIMAADLARTPVTGLEAQICGDAHLANFGIFASPERDLVFDINDFDETLHGPWEWDLKRLATSFAIASRHNGFRAKEERDAVRSAIRYYREAMNRFAGMPALEVWYAHVRAAGITDFLAKELDIGRSRRKQLNRERKRATAKARSRDSYHAAAKLTERTDRGYRFISDPPFVVPLSELQVDAHPDELRRIIEQAFEGYRSSLPESRRALLDRYELVDLALKVVGVGSVGTRCFVALFEGWDAGDPLILQFKEAGPSVLAEFLEPSPYANQGQRVVEGQQLMQTASDIFLGWTTFTNERATPWDCYWRQLKDMKLSAPIEQYNPERMDGYARLCGLTLAHAHARTGDTAAIAGYIGSGDVLIDAMVEFASSYADQNERDYQEFVAASETGALIRDDGTAIAR